jgi:hypothetical protein
VLDHDTLDHPVSPTDVSGTLHLVGDDARLWLARKAKLRKRIATLDYVISEPPGPINREMESSTGLFEQG